MFAVVVSGLRHKIFRKYPLIWSFVAIPMVNFGIYLQLLEFIAVGLAVGIVALASQRIMGAESIPEWPAYILGVLCLLVVVVQPLGFIGIRREKYRLFRRFHYLNTLLTMAAFACGLAIIIATGVKQSDASDKCERDYYPPNDSAIFSLSQYSGTICNILSAVDIGIMGLIWLILIVVQGYFLFMQRKYSSGQRSGKQSSFFPYKKVRLSDDDIDHRKYESIHTNGNDYLMSTRTSNNVNNAWDARNSYDAYDQASSTRPPHSQYNNYDYVYNYNNYDHSPKYNNYNYYPQPHQNLPYGAKY